MNVRYIDNVKHLYRVNLVEDYQMPLIKKQDIILKKETVSFNNRNRKG